MDAKVGDEIIVEMSKLGAPPRKGRVLAVLGGGDVEHYEVEWEDGRVSIFYPSSSAHVRTRRRSG